jgi:hypothetical protein
MKKASLALFLLAASAGAALAAPSPFAGTWKLNVAKSKLTGDTVSYSKTPTGFRFSNGSTVTYDIVVDGKDHPMIFDRTTAWTGAGKNSWDAVTKAHGTVLSRTHRTLSADGKIMTIAYTEYRADGTTTQESDTYTRVSGGPGLAGKWKDTSTKAASDVMAIAIPGPGRFEISYPTDKSGVSGKTDGSPAPFAGPLTPPGATSHVKAVGPNRWQIDGTLKGKTYFTGSMSVSADGKTLTRTTWIPGKGSEKAVEVYDKS